MAVSPVCRVMAGPAFPPGAIDHRTGESMRGIKVFLLFPYNLSSYRVHGIFRRNAIQCNRMRPDAPADRAGRLHGLAFQFVVQPPADCGSRKWNECLVEAGVVQPGGGAAA